MHKELDDPPVRQSNNDVLNLIGRTIERRETGNRVGAELRDDTVRLDAYGQRLPVHLVHFSIPCRDHDDVSLLADVVEACHGDDRIQAKADREVVVSFDADGVRLPKDFMEPTGARADDKDVAPIIRVVERRDADDRAGRKGHRQGVSAFDADGVRFPEDLVHFPQRGSDEHQMSLLVRVVEASD